jgi:hypothetical protein
MTYIEPHRSIIFHWKESEKLRNGTGFFSFLRRRQGTGARQDPIAHEALGQLRQVLDCGGPPPLSDAK